MSKQPPPAPIASAIGPCPTTIKTVGRHGTGSLPRTIEPPDHPIIIEQCSMLTDQPLLMSILPISIFISNKENKHGIYQFSKT